ncbi:response regulator [Fulvivirga kasyanovii]|uniref:Response regulator n=1 Tax=Fulvivirga kasyanovii TaxID=396812 RepID=A0ABW9RVR7_9BACT|nr:response regulator [Fulvivirga kasyanovii]MTI27777.1 response regulator [Fulvivirga kasyanovii]
MELNEVELLLIEDNPYEAELAIRNLRKHKLVDKLYHIDDGAEALEYIFSGSGEDGEPNGIRFNPKVILLDLKLPKVSGQEILKKIRENERTNTIPVVVLTSSNEESDISECYKLGANSYIVKPVNFDNFSRAMKDLSKYWLQLNKRPVTYK